MNESRGMPAALSRRFGARLSLPLIAAPMFRVSGPDLVIAEKRDWLTDLDSAIGDADHGANMARGMDAVVAKLDVGDHKDRPDWMGTVDFSGLKLKLVASIVAISGIALLKAFLDLGTEEELTPVMERQLMWQVIVHITFVVSGVLLAFMDWLTGHQKA